MTEYAHNHPPRCCCHIAPEVIVLGQQPDPCPLCPEHGELAQLANDETPNPIPANVTPAEEIQRAALDATIAGNGYLLNGKRIPPEDVTVVSAEYPCCHQLAGRPHTDYCPTTRGADLGMRHIPTRHHFGDDDHPVHECHPDRCGMWATTPTDPHPATQARDLAAQVKAARDQHADDRVLEDNKGQRWHETGPDEAHETWRCTPAKCGRTPLGTPTPGGICPGCGADYDQTPTEACTTPERHDKPTPIATPTPPADQDTRPCCGRTECNSRGTRCPRWPDCP